MNKKIVLILIFISVLLFIIFTCPLPVKTDMVIQGMECRNGDAAYTKSKSIKIKGTYCNYLIRRDTFEGIIEIEGYDTTFDAKAKPFFDDHAFALFYRKNDLSIVTDPFGYMLCTPNFDKIVFYACESNGWSKTSGLFICGDVDNREEALEMVRYLSSKNKRFSRISWK